MCRHLIVRPPVAQTRGSPVYIGASIPAWKHSEAMADNPRRDAAELHDVAGDPSREAGVVERRVEDDEHGQARQHQDCAPHCALSGHQRVTRTRIVARRTERRTEGSFGAIVTGFTTFNLSGRLYRA